MKFVIIEDEPFAQRELQRLIEAEVPEADIVAVLESVEECQAFFAESPKVDLVFMDIQLADGNSFELLETGSFDYPVVFTTAYDAFALKAFELNSIDYLLKPVDETKLKHAIGKWKKRAGTDAGMQEKLEFMLSMMKQPETPVYKSRFLVRIGDQFKRVEAEEIAYFKAEGNDTEVFLNVGPGYVVDYTLDKLEALLNPDDFFKISRNYLVKADAVKHMEKYGNGQLALELIPAQAERVLVSRSKYHDFLNWMGK
jgi:DNA-binding LytR/AlgR family response regulator